jgi:hypothetical protein
MTALLCLVQVGIDDFSVLTFGSHAVLVKGPDTPWDATCQLALLEQVNCKKGKVSGDLTGTGTQPTVNVVPTRSTASSQVNPSTPDSAVQ